MLLLLCSIYDKKVQKPILGLEEDYIIDEFGVVTNQHTNSVVKAHYDKRGYTGVNTYVNKKNVKRLVHQLVALTYLGLPPGPIGKTKGSYQVDHIDGNKSNNHYSNLEWVNVEENVRRAVAQGKFNHGKNRGTKSPNSLLTNELVEEIRIKASKGKRLRELSQEYNICIDSINRIVQGKSYKGSPGPITLEQSQGFLYKITSPDGIKFETLNLSNFSKKHNLPPTNLNQVATGKAHQMNGWKVRKYKDEVDVTPICKNENLIFDLTDPLGNTYKTTSLRNFCKDYKELNYKWITNSIFTTKHYKGWTITRTDLSKTI